jgi:lipopolysaccharide/colanic/teichoic acid biosynthesis glycosyltransferase
MRGLDSELDSAVKRAFDMGLSISVLLGGWPIWLGIGWAIRMETPGPALFRPKRLGLGGKVFRCNKYRTMRTGCEEKVSPDLKTIVEENDARVTGIGRVLRHGLDEIPQLINIIKGEMSFVGPRPDEAWMWPRYSEKLKERLSVRPGITGLAVVMDSRGLTTEEGYKIDIWYAQNQSLLLDLAIVLSTPFYVIGFRSLWSSMRKRILDDMRHLSLLKEVDE